MLCGSLSVVCSAHVSPRSVANGGRSPPKLTQLTFSSVSNDLMNQLINWFIKSLDTELKVSWVNFGGERPPFATLRGDTCAEQTTERLPHNIFWIRASLNNKAHQVKKRSEE